METLEARIRELEDQAAAGGSNPSQALAQPTHTSPIPSGVDPVELHPSQSPQPVFTISSEAEQPSSLDTEVLRRENADLKRENAELRASVAKEQADKLALWQRLDSLDAKFESFLSSHKADSTPSSSSSSSQAPSTAALHDSIAPLTEASAAQPLVARERSSLPRKPANSSLNGTTTWSRPKTAAVPLWKPHMHRSGTPSTSRPAQLGPTALPRPWSTLSSAQQKQAAKMLARLLPPISPTHNSRRMGRRRQTNPRTQSISTSSTWTTRSTILPQPISTPSGFQLWIHLHGRPLGKKASTQPRHFVFRQ